MNLKTYYILAISCSLFFSCTKETDIGSPDDHSHNAKVIDPMSNKMSVNDVIGYSLDLVKKSFPKTRSLRSVSNVEIIRRADMASCLPQSNIKVYNAENGDDTLLYVVNFANNQGFTILSQDRRVPILAIADDGNFELSKDNPSVTMFLSATELYINETIRISDSIQTSQRDDSRPYIVSFPHDDPPFYLARFLGHEDVYKESGDIPINVEPLLRTRWHQMAPFNGGLDVCKVCKEPNNAGCMPIAVAQIAAYYQFPKHSISYTEYDWLGMASYVYGEHERKPEHIQLLLKDICKAMSIVYEHYWDGNHATYSNIKPQCNAFNRITTLGFTADTWNVAYDTHLITRSIDINNPVLISGYAGPNLDGHAWVLDGYKKLPSTTLSVYEVWQLIDGTIYKKLCKRSTPVTTQGQYLIHCNWGWDALARPIKANGYYNSGVWSSAAAHSYDYEDGDDRWFEYNYDVKVCTGVRPK